MVAKFFEITPKQVEGAVRFEEKLLQAAFKSFVKKCPLNFLQSILTKTELLSKNHVDFI